MKNNLDSTPIKIKQEARRLFASVGYEGFSIRLLAEKSGVGLSSIYHFFEDKDAILDAVFDEVSQDLGRHRHNLPSRRSASAMLRDRIMFQFEHIEEVTFVLKYYLHFRDKFKKNANGYIPTKAYLHIEEVLRFGARKAEFTINLDDIEKEAKVIAHAINGFLLEYYPEVPKKRELTTVVTSIHAFLMRSLIQEKGVRVL